MDTNVYEYFEDYINGFYKNFIKDYYMADDAHDDQSELLGFYRIKDNNIKIEAISRKGQQLVFNGNKDKEFLYGNLSVNYIGNTANQNSKSNNRFEKNWKTINSLKKYTKYIKNCDIQGMLKLLTNETIDNNNYLKTIEEKLTSCFKLESTEYRKLISENVMLQLYEHAVRLFSFYNNNDAYISFEKFAGSVDTNNGIDIDRIKKRVKYGKKYNYEKFNYKIYLESLTDSQFQNPVLDWDYKKGELNSNIRLRKVFKVNQYINGKMDIKIPVWKINDTFLIEKHSVYLKKYLSAFNESDKNHMFFGYMDKDVGVVKDMKVDIFEMEELTLDEQKVDKWINGEYTNKYGHSLNEKDVFDEKNIRSYTYHDVYLDLLLKPGKIKIRKDIRKTIDKEYKTNLASLNNLSTVSIAYADILTYLVNPLSNEKDDLTSALRLVADSDEILDNSSEAIGLYKCIQNKTKKVCVDKQAQLLLTEKLFHLNLLNSIMSIKDANCKNIQYKRRKIASEMYYLGLFGFNQMHKTVLELFKNISDINSYDANLLYICIKDYFRNVSLNILSKSIYIIINYLKGLGGLQEKRDFTKSFKDMISSILGETDESSFLFNNLQHIYSIEDQIKIKEVFCHLHYICKDEYCLPIYPKLIDNCFETKDEIPDEYLLNPPTNDIFDFYYNDNIEVAIHERKLLFDSFKGRKIKLY